MASTRMGNIHLDSTMNWLDFGGRRSKVKVTVTHDQQNLISSLLRPSGCLCKIWRNCLKLFLRFRAHKIETANWQPKNKMPLATAIASTEAEWDWFELWWSEIIRQTLCVGWLNVSYTALLMTYLMTYNNKERSCSSRTNTIRPPWNIWNEDCQRFHYHTNYFEEVRAPVSQCDCATAWY